MKAEKCAAVGPLISPDLSSRCHLDHCLPLSEVLVAHHGQKHLVLYLCLYSMHPKQVFNQVQIWPTPSSACPQLAVVPHRFGFVTGLPPLNGARNSCPLCSSSHAPLSQNLEASTFCPPLLLISDPEPSKLPLHACALLHTRPKGSLMIALLTWSGSCWMCAVGVCSILWIGRVMALRNVVGFLVARFWTCPFSGTSIGGTVRPSTSA
ncbi:uncharacterized protein [Thunnus thynnus]|uniref:uncharacterized protein n=1 Tax=Thunnus thynnus TaxID=8237 RepID=UPI00352852D0